MLPRAFLSGDFAAGGIEGIQPFVAGEGDDVGNGELGAAIDDVFGAREDLLVMARIVQAFDEHGIGHAVQHQ